MPKALITGAAKRVGRVIAQTLARDGYDLVLHANRSIKERDELAEELRATGIQVEVETGDMAFPDQVKALGERVAAGGLDVAIHNASIYYRQSFGEVSEAEYDKMQQVNCKAPVLLTQALLPALQKSEQASVVFLGDAAAERVYPNFTPYFISKAGMLMAMKCLALELAPKIRVNAVGPGVVMLPPWADEEEISRSINAAPLKRIGEAEDIARAVQFVLQSPFVTGQHIKVDGGLSAR